MKTEVQFALAALVVVLAVAGMYLLFGRGAPREVDGSTAGAGADDRRAAPGTEPGSGRNGGAPAPGTPEAGRKAGDKTPSSVGDRTVTGTVETPEGRGLPGVRVSTGSARAETDGSGRFRLSVPAGKQILSFEKEGFRSASAELRKDGSGDNVRMVLLPLAGISGSVRHVGSRLLAPMTVRLEGGPHPMTQQIQGEEGHFAFGDLMFGVPYTVVALSPDAATASDPVVLDSSAPSFNLDLVLDGRAASRLKVEAVSASGEQVIGRFDLLVETEQEAYRVPFEAPRDTIELKPGTYRVTLAPGERWVGPSRPLTVVVVPGGKGTLEIPVFEMASVRLVFEGTVPRRAFLHAVSARSVQSIGVDLPRRDALPLVFLAGLPHRFWLDSPEGFSTRPHDQELSPGLNEIRLRFEEVAAPSLRGRVVDDLGRPMEDLPIAIVDPAGDRLGARTGPLGTFLFTSLPPGDYRLQVEAPDGLCAPAERPKVTVAETGAAPPLEVTLVRAARIGVEARDGGGRLVPGAAMRLVPTDDPYLDVVLIQSGEKRLVQPGAYDIEVLSHAARVQHVEMAPGEERTVEVRIDAGS